jgi:FkbM family methyltransferase
MARRALTRRPRAGGFLSLRALNRISIVLSCVAVFGIFPFVSFFYCEPCRVWFLLAAGRRTLCPIDKALEIPSNRRLDRQREKSLAKECRILERDAANGLELWDTPLGRYWVPRADPSFFYLILVEEQRGIYGTPGRLGVHQGDVVLDCGAHVGTFTRQALNAGARQVIAIEPFSKNLVCLRRNFETEIAQGRVVIFEKGVWDHEDVLDFAESSDASTMGSVIFARGPKMTRIPVTTIDKLVTELKLTRVDFIKMDIEGAERNALMGASQTISGYRPRMALCTYHRADDPEKIISLVRGFWPDFRLECVACIEDRRHIYPETVMIY